MALKLDFGKAWNPFLIQIPQQMFAAHEGKPGVYSFFSTCLFHIYNQK